ncbi:MAG: VOC family protein [Candidatus Bathyarchaeia archaeon]
MSTGFMIPEDRIMLREVAHLCIAVRDVERAAKAFAEIFGIGPFRVRVLHTPSSRGFVHGEPAEFTIKFGFARLGPITLELAQPLEGRTILQDFLKERGEGIHHIGLPAPTPFEAELEKWRRQGIHPLQSSRMEDPEEGWAYMDTQNLVGCILEILCFKRYQ